MLKSYMVIALRMLLRYRMHAIISIAGLAVGLASCLLIGLFVSEEVSYDRFHQNYDHIYRLTLAMGKAAHPTNANSSYGQGLAAARFCPEVESVVRLRKMGWGEKRVVAAGNRRFYEPDLIFADSTFLSTFTFPVVSGEPSQALSAPFTAALTRQSARKYFGDVNPIGQTLDIDIYNDGKFQPFEITAVLEDIPTNSTLQFAIVGSFAGFTDTQRSQYGLEPVWNFLKLRSPADTAIVTARLAEHLAGLFGAQQYYTIHLQPMREFRGQAHLNGEILQTSDGSYIYIFSGIALFILLLAIINFMNLSTARATRRSREVGIRKVVGADRRQLVWQFMGESLFVSLVAALVAVGLAELMLPVLNNISNKTVTIDILQNLPMFASLLGLAVFTGLIAGIYPAFVLSHFRPIDTLKGKASVGSQGGVLVRRGLVVLQYAIAIGLVVCTLISWQQMNYIRTRNLGFDREQIIVAPLNHQLRADFSVMYDRLLATPGVLDVSASEQVPSNAGNGGGYLLAGRQEPIDAARLFADPHFAATYGLHLLAGEDFSRTRTYQPGSAFLVNEAFLKLVDIAQPADAVGQALTVGWGGKAHPGVIIGVVADFNFMSLHEPVDAAVINPMSDDMYNFLSIRLAAGTPVQAIDQIRQLWAKHAPDYPFEYTYVDEDFARLHRADQQFGAVVRVFAVLAILVACLGLFGLSAFTAEMRTKEIGLRKVLGAAVPGLVGLMIREFVFLVVLANLIAGPLAWYAMNRWLSAFAYRVPIELSVFAAAGGMALMVALLTVAAHAVRTALSNPVDTLRYE